MAVIGTSSGGYATLSPTQGNPISEAMQNVENSAFKYRAEKREEDQVKAREAKARKDALDAEAKDIMDYSNTHKIVPTSIDSFNKASFYFTTAHKKKYSNFKNTLNFSSDPEERQKAYDGLANLQSAYDIYKAAPEMLNATALDLEKGVREGKYNPNSSIEAGKTIKAFSDGSIKPVIGEDGITKWITYQRDAKGNLTDIIDKELTTEQIKLKLSPVTNYDSTILAAEFKKSLGDKVKTDSGTKTIEGYAGLANTAEKTANAIVTDRDKMYGIAPDVGIQPKFDISDYTPEEIIKVKEYIQQSLTEKYKDSVTDNDAKLSRIEQEKARKQAQANFEKKFNYDKEKDEKGEPKEELGVENINKIGVVVGNQKIKDSAVEKADGATAYSIQGSNLERSFGKDGAYERVKNIYVLKDGKTIAFDVDRVDGKTKTDDDVSGETSTSSKTTKISYNSAKNANEIADFVTKKKNPKTGKYYKNIQEFSSHALGIKPTEKQVAKPSQNTKPKEDLRKKYNY